MKHTFQQQLRRPTGGAFAVGSRSRKRSAGILPTFAAATALTALVGLAPAQAADVTYNFDSGQPAGVTIGGNHDDSLFVPTGGNPASGGFLALTYSENSQTGILVFGDTDPGKVVTGFSFSCDLRVGNSTGDRAADGFSVSFARAGDPFLSSLSDGDLGGNCCAETGTKTGVAVSFDTWSGNTFPTDPNDTSDIEGIIVRVDNVTVKKVGLPTRHGTADDITSLQTGPRDAAYWANSGDPRDPGAWAGLAWRPFAIDMTPEGKLTVTWKGNKILDGEQTTYFPSAGQLVFAGRTGGANENTHVDNIHLVTTAQAVTAVPGAPPNLKVAEAGSRRIALSWDAAVVAGDPNARVAYEVERDGVVLNALQTTTTYVDRGVAPGKSYVYKVRGKNIAGLTGPDSTVTGTTGADAPGVAFLRADVWYNISGVDPSSGLSDPHISDPPDRSFYVNGFGFGETSGYGNTFGENFVAVMSGVLTAPETASYRFFTRADDGMMTFVNTAGAAIPNFLTDTPIQLTDGSACCQGFLDVAEDGTVPPQTSEPVALVAGREYGVTFLVKEGGGGDWGELAIRKEGEVVKTPAGSLKRLQGAIVRGPVDPVGASISITQNPADTTTVANSPVTFTAAASGSSPYGGDYGNAISYQWYVNNLPILGANGTTFTVDVTPASYNGAKVKVVAAVAGASATSTEANLTVNADTVAPTVAEVSGSDTFDTVTVTFSEPVADPSATTASNYQITGLTVNSATRTGLKTVQLSTSKQGVETTYPITVKGVRDNAGLPSDYTGSFATYKFQKGIVVFNLWNDENGGFDTFPGGTPDQSRVLTSAYTGSGLYENYFGQLKMIFRPTQSGNYVFFMSTDDHGELYLSTNSDPANKKKIAEEPSWSDPRLWNGDGSGSNTGTRGDVGGRANRSDEYPSTEWGTGNTITLQANTDYYLELLYKEGGGGDHGAIAVKLASEADPGNGGNELGGDRVGWYIDPNKIAPIITKRPTGANVAAGDAVALTVEVQSAPAVTYQWFHNKKAIQGATSATYSIAKAGVADIGDYYVEVSNKNGTATSYPDDDVRVTVKGAYVIEMEDYNHGSGQTVAAASTMPLASGLFEGKDGIPDVDYHSGSVSGGADDANGNSYRNGWVDGNGTVFPAPSGTGGNLDVIIDDGGGNTVRPDFTLGHNYKIGWGGTGNWFNYTRTFEAGTYAAVFVGSRDGRGAAAMGRTLALVTGDITKPEQANTVIGELTTDGTGAWSSNDWVPFLKPGSSDLATFDLSGTKTLRVTISSGDGDNDALLLYKVNTVVAPPVITGVTVDGTKVTITWTGGGQLEATESLGGAFSPIPGATGGSYTYDTGLLGAPNIVYARVRN
ncbi:MAG: immunoglobulin domain-containing protein [Verrucomicrobiales bacterium]|nr:immunoglobulin domain-containing protein [Verrucomicrobiales bacterium]